MHTFKTKAQELKFLTLMQAFRLPPPTWLCDGILTDGGLSLLVGAPGIGKTFSAIDLAMSVAVGKPWLNKPTKQGRVIYVAAEGLRSVMRRMAAWCYYHGIKTPPEDILILPQAIDLLGGELQAEAFLEGVAEHFPTTTEYWTTEDGEEEPVITDEKPLRLIVVDTLARCVVGGDENAAEDMGKAVAFCDYLRKAMNVDDNTDTHVMLIHHTNKAGTAERGSTALRGAVDTLLSVHRSKAAGIYNMNILKQRDGEDGIAIPLELCPVERLQTMVMTGRIVAPSNVEGKVIEAGGIKPKELSPRQIDVLLYHFGAHDQENGRSLTEIGKGVNMSTPNAQFYRNNLKDKGYLVALDNGSTVISVEGIEYLMAHHLLPDHLTPTMQAVIDAAIEVREQKYEVDDDMHEAAKLS